MSSPDPASAVASDDFALEPKALRYEPFPLLSDKERRAGARRPIALILIAAGEIDGEQTGVILAWLPGALKPGSESPRDERVLERFKVSMESAANAGAHWLPQELGEAASQLSADPGFKALFNAHELGWSFGHTRAGLTSAGQPWESRRGLARCKASLLEWASARLSSFTLTIEEGFYEKMAENENAIEERVIQGLAVREEARKLERVVKAVKGASEPKRRRAGL